METRKEELSSRARRSAIRVYLYAFCNRQLIEFVISICGISKLKNFRFQWKSQISLIPYCLFKNYKLDAFTNFSLSNLGIRNITFRD